MKNRLHRLLLSTALIFSLFASAQAQQMGISVATTQNGNEVTADFLVYNFTDIISMQYSINWDASQMEFVEVSQIGLPNMNTGSFGTLSAQDGVVTTSWFDNTISGITVPPCQSIFTMKFELIGSTIPPITFGNSPTVIEIMQFVGGDFVEMELIQNSGCDDIGILSGNLFHDNNLDCIEDAGENGIENWIVQIEGNGFTFYRNTDSDGNFDLFLSEGNYDLTLILPQNNLWGACGVTQNLDITQDETTEVSFAAQALIDCPALSVDISAPFLRRCFSSYYQVDYCNNGTITGEDAYVEIEFDEEINVLTSSIPWSTVDGNTYTFQLGDVEVGQCGSFGVEIMVDCEATLGATHCTEAQIFPQTPCDPPSPLWDGSSLQVDGACNGDEVVFTITNIGDDMQSATEFVIIEDDMMAYPPVPVQLTSMESTQAVFSANGSSYRLQLTQSEYHPGQSMPTASVEGCIDGMGNVSLGFIGQFPEDDLDPWVDIDCQENIGSWDPNDKIGYPLGYGAQHFIEPGTEIEYRIRFQNTGTDTAFNITVLDTLSSLLDPSTIRLGAASHPFEFDLSGEGIMKFDFPMIMLPDSSANLEGSNGFVKFTISTRGGVPLGSVVENSAAIYFDFNEPVITNTYFHTVDEDFIMQEPSAVGFIPFSDVQVFLTPNPMADGERPLLLVQSQNVKKLQFQIFDLEGKSLFIGEDTASEGSTLISIPTNMHRGVYLLQVTDSNGHGQTLKMLVR